MPHCNHDRPARNAAEERRPGIPDENGPDPMKDEDDPQRCRLVLVTPASADAAAVEAALSGGDVASLLIAPHGLDEASFQKLCERLVPAAQERGAAAIVAGDGRMAMRTDADGIHFEGRPAELAELVSRHRPRLIVGCGGATTRDEALALGEADPDYVFFGRFGYDSRPEPHSRNLSLGGWWAQMINVPCIVQAGSTMESVERAAGTGAEFVAVSAAVFEAGIDPAQAVAQANAALERLASEADARAGA
jgi:thiamine-phosphate pyrophosphorylase